MTSAPKPQKKQKVAVLTSGGIVSLALLEYCAERYGTVVPLYVQCGFRCEEAELFWLKKLLRGRKKDNVEPLEVIPLPLRDIYQTHWSVTGVKVPSGKDRLKDTHIQGRDVLLLMKAALYGVHQGAQVFAIGFSKSHSFHGHPETVRSQIEQLVAQSLDNSIEIIAPFENKRREDILFNNQELGSEYSFSCLSPKGYQHCGECFKCHERKMSFFKTGIADKTHYYRSLSATALTV